MGDKVSSYELLRKDVRNVFEQVLKGIGTFYTIPARGCSKADFRHILLALHQDPQFCDKDICHTWELHKVSDTEYRFHIQIWCDEPAGNTPVQCERRDEDLDDLYSVLEHLFALALVTDETTLYRRLPARKYTWDDVQGVLDKLNQDIRFSSHCIHATLGMTGGDIEKRVFLIIIPLKYAVKESVSLIDDSSQTLSDTEISLADDIALKYVLECCPEDFKYHIELPSSPETDQLCKDVGNKLFNSLDDVFKVTHIEHDVPGICVTNVRDDSSDHRAFMKNDVAQTLQSEAILAIVRKGTGVAFDVFRKVVRELQSRSLTGYMSFSREYSCTHLNRQVNAYAANLLQTKLLPSAINPAVTLLTEPVTDNSGNPLYKISVQCHWGDDDASIDTIVAAAEMMHAPKPDVPTENGAVGGTDDMLKDIPKI